MRRRLLVPALLAVALSGVTAYAVTAGGAAAAPQAQAPAAAATPRVAFQPTERPLAATPEELGLPAVLAAPATSVSTVAGPMSDRVRWDGLRLDADALAGDLVVISDVSEIISATVAVAFYDAAGARLDVREQVFAEYDGAHDQHGDEGYETKVEGEPQALAVPAPAGSASALVALRDLVNE